MPSFISCEVANLSGQARRVVTSRVSSYDLVAQFLRGLPQKRADGGLWLVLLRPVSVCRACMITPRNDALLRDMGLARC